MMIRFVRLYKTALGDEEAEENRRGLRLLQRSGVIVDVVRECDWLFLMNVLSNTEGRGQQGQTAERVKQELEKIFQDPKNQDTNTPSVVTAHASTMTDEVEPVNVVVKEEDSSSDDDD